jgi:hypothetical protein
VAQVSTSPPFANLRKFRPENRRKEKIGQKLSFKKVVAEKANIEFHAD